MGIKRPTTLSFSSHTFCWSHLRFSSFSSNTIQWVLRHFLQERKEQSVILCNNNIKKNYCPPSSKKREESVAAHFCQVARRGGRRLSEVRDANTHWRRAWELQQHLADRGTRGRTETPSVRSPGSIVSYARSRSVRFLSCRSGIVVFFT